MTRRKRKGGGRERGVERRGRPLIVQPNCRVRTFIQEMTGKPDWLTVAVFHWAILTASTRARPPPTRSGTVRHHPQRLPRRNRRRARGERTFSVRPNACPTPADARRARVEPDDLAPRVRIDHRRRGARSRVLAFPARPAPRSSSHGLESLSRRRRALCCLARSVVVGMMGRGGGAPPLQRARAFCRNVRRAHRDAHALRVRIPARGVATGVVAERKNRSRRGSWAHRRTGGKQASPRASLVHLHEVLRARRKTGSKQASP